MLHYLTHLPVLWIRIRIRMFFDLLYPDPDPYVSISQRHGSADTDSYQNVKDPQHYLLQCTGNKDHYNNYRLVNDCLIIKTC
jgi:hypothetical protein